MSKPVTKLAPGIILLGIAFIVFLVSAASLLQGRSLAPQFTVPGEHQIEVSEPGRYFLWDNYRTWHDGATVTRSAQFPSAFSIKASGSGGAEISFTPDRSHSWSIGNHAKRSIGFLDIPETDTLTIEVTGDTDTRIVSLAKADMKKELWLKLGGFGLALIIAIIGIPLLLWGLSTRIRSA